MRKLVFLLILSLGLTGCLAPQEVPVTTIPATLTSTLPITEPTTAPTTEPFTEPATESAETEPKAQLLYIPGVSVEDVIAYFNEVCLDAEFVNGGDPSRLQRWEEPIYYDINGDPTPEDLEVLRSFVEWLNGIEGFPGMYEAASPMEARLDIHFTDSQSMVEILGENFTGMDGGVTFWYQSDIIYRGTICYLSTIHQDTRNSVILEEIYNGLGPVQDTDLRQDSIIYSGYSEPQSLTPIDELLLRLLYHPQMQCGMSASECEAVIRQLYQEPNP